ncbi:hypothetical protein Q7P37_009349 [Cladosporium fusiforme]
MATEYFYQQPQGSKNRIENVAIVGAGGQVGSYITRALLSTGKHQVTAITRASSTSTFAEGVKRQTVDYSDHESMVSGLRGQDFLIVTMSVTAGDAQAKLLAAAHEAGVRWVMPNEYGGDYAAGSFGADVHLAPAALATRKAIVDAGMNFVALSCSFWYEYSLAGTAVRYGFDFGQREVTFYDEGETKITTSTWPQVGRAVAALLSLPVWPVNEEDGQLTLSKFQNRSAFVGSFHVSQKDMFASVLRVTGTREEDWKVGYESAEARFQRGGELLAQGKMEGFGMLLYARAFYKDGAGDLQAKLNNEELGLPEEDFDEATAVAVERAKGEVV